MSSDLEWTCHDCKVTWVADFTQRSCIECRGHTISVEQPVPRALLQCRTPQRPVRPTYRNPIRGAA